jgi:protoheme IX farnesyltransferase
MQSTDPLPISPEDSSVNPEKLDHTREPDQTLLKDILNLMKPNITSLVLITTTGGIFLAPGSIRWSALWAAILGTLGVVIGANTLNCYIERDSDKLMGRTKNRPLPTGRISARGTLIAGLLITLVSTLAIMFWVNLTTTYLALIAFVSYVWIYTPMKRLSPQALVVGSLPGALPPLMGWTAVTGSLDLPGIVLFGILFFWQIPHFIAIAFYRQREYERAGLKTFPSQYGHLSALIHGVLWSALLVATSLALFPLGVAGWIYLVICSVLGAILLWYSLMGFWAPQRNLWARRFFLYTLIYLTVLFIALAIDTGSLGQDTPLPIPQSFHLPS